jgi:hypothetical protein
MNFTGNSFIKLYESFIVRKFIAALTGSALMGSC